MLASVLRSVLNLEKPLNAVFEAKSDVFITRHIHLREDGLIIYLPEHDSNKKSYYEIVLHTSQQVFSLCRTTTKEDAEIKFIMYKDNLLVLVEIAKEMLNVQGLQKICDILSEHPTWNVAHLAAYFALFESFNHPKIISYLNSTDDETGMSPLQVAIITKNLKTVQLLVAAGCTLEHLDHNLDSVFHFAATTNKDIIAALTQGSPPGCLNLRNKNGYTPLHIACQADKRECVNALLLAGADVNKTATATDDESHQPGYVGDYLQNHPNSLHKEDMKLGGTPLHWAFSRQVVDALIDMNCHIDAKNFEEQTALHVMVLRNRLECVVALLSRNANPNIEDADGNRPLHLAVKEGNIPIIQSLIIFGADFDIVNNLNQSPRHLITVDDAPKLLYYLHAVGAKRCPAGVPNCTEGCRPGGTYDGIPPAKVIGPTNRDILNQMLDVAGMEIASQRHRNCKLQKNGRLLCLDGGGIRGLILVQMLLELEKIIDKPINNCFDWLAGTSTGGILALGIAAGKTMHECLCLYFRMKDLTFVGMRPYSSEKLENILKTTFGPETVMANIPHPKVMVTGVLADRKPAELHLFRNYESPSNLLDVKHDSPYELPPPPEEQYVWQVGRATGAAPTYFRAFGRFLDGGLIANNPTLDALTEIHEHCLAMRAIGREDEACPVSVVVSIGTGLIPVTEVKEIDVFLPEKLLDSLKLYSGMSALGALLVDQATASDGRVVDRARAWCSSIGVPYFRFSPQMSVEVAMNEKSDEILANVLWETKVYMHENINIIRELYHLLSNE